MEFLVWVKEFYVGKPIKSKWRDLLGSKYFSKLFWFVLIYSIVLFFSLLCLNLFFFKEMAEIFYFSSSDSSKYLPIYFTRNSSDAKTSLDNSKASENSSRQLKTNKDLCSGRYVYIHNLPKRFNEDVLKDCERITSASDRISMCTYIKNYGLGLPIENSDALGFWKSSWFSTNQFMLELIFHNRLKKYECLTNDSTLASAIYVPFYAGLDLRRYLWGFNTTVRDASGIDLVKWLTGKPEWKRMWGKDHFIVTGRIARDFRRPPDRKSARGSKFRFLPESQNISMLTIESGSKNDFGIPYPTYFHPSTDNEVFQWQELMRRQNRPYLFSFAGAPRALQKGSIRSEIISECEASKNLCNLLDCGSIEHKCDDPVNVMMQFRRSVFCLQPPGDSPTRRSTFDSILAGCIPVFFHPASAYSQYVWHLPKNHTKYSVFISERNFRVGRVRINQTLLQVSEDEQLAMREEVIRLIPRIIYAHPRSRLQTIEDAFDIALKEILNTIGTLRNTSSQLGEVISD